MKGFTAIVILFFTFVSCSNGLNTVDLIIGESSYRIEIARTPEERQKGLMNRKSVPEKTGMLFVFENDRKLSFWMKNTLVPLSIAYISSDGVIREIYKMEPQSLAPVKSRHFVRYALELPEGAFKKEGVREGDRIILPESVQ